MKSVYCVMVCKKFSKEGLLSSECYNTLKKAQFFCESRYNTRKVNDLYYSSNNYDYKIHILTVK